jgi:hypothetical protein
LSLNPDGSEDHELKIKGLPDIKVGDYTRREPGREDGLGSLLPVDVEAIAAAKITLATQVEVRRVKIAAALPDVAMGEDEDGHEEARRVKIAAALPDVAMGEDEDGHEEVLTLGRMHARSQARVNRYYTAAENEEVEDDGGNCNDNGLTISSNVDSDQSFDSDSEGDEDFNEAIDSDIDQRDENI